MAIRIRIYREEDRERLKEITIAAFPGVSIDRAIEERFGVLNGVDWAARKRQSIDADCEAHPAGILVAEAEEGQQVVGYITTRLNHDTGLGWIPNMAVDPACQGVGIGKQLMQAALDYLRAAGMTHVKIETLVANERGQVFYPSVGFVEVARQIHYVADLRR